MLDFETGIDQTGEPKLQTNIEAIFQKLFRKFYCLTILSDTVFEDYHLSISRWGFICHVQSSTLFRHRVKY